LTTNTHVSSFWGKQAFTYYLGVNGTDYKSLDGVFCLGIARRTAEIKDGLSNTLMFGERLPGADGYFGWWYCGQGINGTLLGAREINAWIQGNAQCELGPYHFQAGDLDQQCDSLHFWSMHPGGENFVFADGSVKFLPYEADVILPAMATIKGREVAAEY